MHCGGAGHERSTMLVDVLVVGAGPTGLSLAIALSRHGLSVRIVDQREAPTTEPRAAVIWPRAAEALDDLGVGSAVHAAANELGTLHVYSRGDRLGTARLGQLPSAFPMPLLIEQHVTERVLAAHLADLGTQVEWGATATRIRLDPDGATVTLGRTTTIGETAQCAWLVGCDGAHSFVRARLGVDFPGKAATNLQIMQVDAVPTWRFPRCHSDGYYFLASRACLGCFPVGGEAYRFFCYTDDPHPRVNHPPTATEMQELIARVAGTPELRLDEVSWLNRARFQTRFAARLRVGRAFLAGDAAHVWPSLGGHGMNIGLQGAHNLAWKLAAVQRGRAPEALLDTYESEERATVARFLELMRLNFLERPSRAGGLRPRELALRLGLSLPMVGRVIERAASDLTANHRHSALSQATTRRHVRLRWRRGLYAGDRLPDVDGYRSADGRSARLHALVTYQRWTLILPAGLPDPARARVVQAVHPWRRELQIIGAVEQSSSAALRLARGEVILVRPDRHIGLVAHQNDLQRVRSYLERWLGSAEDLSRSPASDAPKEMSDASCAA